MTPLFYLATFIAVALAMAAWWSQPGGEFPSIRLPRLREPRLSALWSSGSWATERQQTTVFTAPLTVLGRFVPRWPRQRETLRNRLSYIHSNLTVEAFSGFQLVAALGGVLVVSAILVELKAAAPLWLGLAAVGGFMAPQWWLHARITRRHRAIIRLLPEVIDLLSLCVGAGLDFLGALNKVVFVKTFGREPLIEELAVALQEIRLGQRRLEALRGLAKRINLPEVSSFVRTLVQADRMGTPVGEVLAVHAEDLRLQRFTSAERSALKAPIKILFPLIFFIMPCVALIVAAPIFLQFMHQNPFGR